MNLLDFMRFGLAGRPDVSGSRPPRKRKRHARKKLMRRRQKPRFPEIKGDVGVYRRKNTFIGSNRDARGGITDDA